MHHRAGAEVAPVNGTDVCGSLPVGATTWSALGAPYTICPAGVAVPTGAALVIDGSLGPVTVQAAGAGGLTVDGGSLATIGTSASSVVTFTSAQETPARGDWAGIIAGDQTQTTTSGLRLSYVNIQYADPAVAAYNMPPVALDHLNIGNSGSGAIARGTDITLTDSSIDNVGYGLWSLSGAVDLQRDTFANTTDGVYVSGPSAHLTDIKLAHSASTGIQAYADDLTLKNVDVEQVGLTFPAVRVESDHLDLGPLGDIQNVTGANNGWDAIEIGGSTVLGSFVWTSADQHTTPLPLGYVIDDPVTFLGPGTVVVPVGAHVVINGRLTLQDVLFDASAGGATIDAGPDYMPGSASPDDEIYVPYDGGANRLSGVVLLDARVTHVSFEVRNEGIALVSTNSELTDSHVNAFNTPVDITGGSIDNGYINEAGAGLTVNGVHIFNPPTTGEGQFLNYRDGGLGTTAITVETTDDPIDIEDNLIENFGGGVQIGSWPGAFTGEAQPKSHHVVVRNNEFRRCGLVFQGLTGNSYSGYPIVLENVSGSFGPAGDIYGNTGAGNAFDEIYFTGDVTSDFEWVTPYNSPIEHPLGYVTAGIRVIGPFTLTLPPNAIMKVAGGGRGPGSYSPTPGSVGVELDGASLVAGPGSVITDTSDASVGLSACYWDANPAACEATPPFVDMWWPGINVHTDPTGLFRGTAVLTGSALRYGALRIDSGAATAGGQPFGLVAKGLSVVGGEIIAVHTAVLLDEIGVDQSRPPIDQAADATPYLAGVSVRGSSKSLIENSTFANMESGFGIDLDAADATLTRDTFGFFTTAVLATGGGGQYAVMAGNGRADVSCVSYGPYTAGLQLGSGSTVHDSDLVGGYGHPKDNPYINVGFDVDAVAPIVDASGNWWGQPTGPENMQLTHPENTNASKPRTTPSDCAPPLIGSPGPPQALSAKEASPTGATPSVVVSWQPPSTGGSVTGYRVTVGQLPPINVTATTTSLTVPGVTPGRNDVTVSAMSTTGSGPPTSTSVFVVSEPGAPQHVLVSAHRGVATVVWAPPSSNGGSAVLGYRVNIGSQVKTVSASNRGVQFTGLVRGRRYSVVVVARNAYGYGTPSAKLFSAA
jgi:hypothetical protein